MPSVEFWGVSPDDPAVVRALEVHDRLTEDERRNVYRATISSVLAYNRSGKASFLMAFAQGVREMVLLESQPGFTESRRTPSERSPDQGGGLGIEELVRRLRSNVDRPPPRKAPPTFWQSVRRSLKPRSVRS